MINNYNRPDSFVSGAKRNPTYCLISLCHAGRMTDTTMEEGLAHDRKDLEATHDGHGNRGHFVPKTRRMMTEEDLAHDEGRRLGGLRRKQCTYVGATSGHDAVVHDLANGLCLRGYTY